MRLIVTDGGRFERVDADVPRATSVETYRIEDAVERRAALYTHDEQIDRLAASRLSFPELVLDVDEDGPSDGLLTGDQPRFLAPVTARAEQSTHAPAPPFRTGSGWCGCPPCVEPHQAHRPPATASAGGTPS